MEKPTEKPKYLVRPSDFAIFELDESNGCYRVYEEPGKETKNSPQAYSHFTLENLTENYHFFPTNEKNIPLYLEKHAYEVGYLSWQCRNDGHGGIKGGTREEYEEYLERLERYEQKIKNND